MDSLSLDPLIFTVYSAEFYFLPQLVNPLFYV